MLKVPLPIDATTKYLTGLMTQVGGLASLVSVESFGSPFAIAEPGVGTSDLISFEAGRNWRQSISDVALITEIDSAFSQPWWAVCQNAWSQKGDLPSDAWLGPHAFFRDNYLHITFEERTLDLARWRGQAVGFQLLIYLTTVDPVTYTAGDGNDLSEVVGRQIADSTFAIAVSAYDEESWIAVTRRE